MLKELQFLLSSFLAHGSQFKNKINGKIENRTEKGNAPYNEYQPGYSNPPHLLFWYYFPSNIHPN